MNLSTIEAYVEQKNAFRKLFKQPEFSLLRASDRQYIASMLDSDISPENITCDGERAPSQVRQLYAFYTRAAQELKSIDGDLVFAEFDV
jgi:site-specific recombinase XerD